MALLETALNMEKLPFATGKSWELLDQCNNQENILK